MPLGSRLGATGLQKGQADREYLQIDGENSPTANINWGGFKITNLGDATDSGDALNLGLSDGRYIRKAPTANDNIIQVTTADKSALILQTTDDDATENLFETHNAIGSPFVTIDADHQMLLAASAANKVPLVVKAASAHTANLTEWKAVGGSVLTSILASGALDINLGANTVGIDVKASAGQTANLISARNNANSVMFGVEDTGTTNISVFSALTSTTQLATRIAHRTSGTPGDNFGVRLQFNNDTNGGENTHTGSVVAKWAEAAHATRRGAIQFSVADSVAAINTAFEVEADGTGCTIAGFPTAVAGQDFTLGIQVASNVGLVVKGASGQSANLQEWQDSNGASLIEFATTQILVKKALNIITNEDSTTITAIGSGSGNSVTGANNTFYGSTAGRDATTGTGNTAMGSGALQKNTDGMNNVAIGLQALLNTDGGTGNIGIGNNALVANTTGNNNFGMGTNSLVANTTGIDNVALGVSSLRTTVLGSDNVAIGSSALRLMNGTVSTEGRRNVAIGTRAGFNNIIGVTNVFLGYRAGEDETGSSKLYIANSTTATPLILGDFTAGITIHPQATTAVGLTIATPAAYSSNFLELVDSSSNVHHAFGIPGGTDPHTYFNKQLGDSDTIIAGDTIADLFKTDAGLDRVELNGGLAVQTTRVTTTYTILVTDQVVFADTDGGAFTATLPVGSEGQTFKIINVGISTNNLTITPDGAELLIGANSSFVLFDGESLILTYNSVKGWY